MTTETIKDLRKNSPFNKTFYEVNIHIRWFMKNLQFYSESLGVEETRTNSEILDLATPKFQRSNDKWSTEMKTKFVENVIKSFKTSILLYSVIDKNDRRGLMVNCRILDGLQRTTALIDFFENRLEIFKEELGGVYYKDIKEDVDRLSNVTFRIYEFTSEKEVVQFYIDMNENITHSSEDIKKAREYLKSL